jgi:hypothetical protein
MVRGWKIKIEQLSSDMLRILKVLHPSIQDSRRLIATAHTHRLRLPIHTRKLQVIS